MIYIYWTWVIAFCAYLPYHAHHEHKYLAGPRVIPTIKLWPTLNHFLSLQADRLENVKQAACYWQDSYTFYTAAVKNAQCDAIRDYKATKSVVIEVRE